MGYFDNKRYNKGFAFIEKKKFSYYYENGIYFLLPIGSSNDKEFYSKLRKTAKNSITIFISPLIEDMDIRGELFDISYFYVSFDGQIEVVADSVFLYKVNYKINTLEFHGPSIDKLVQDYSFRHNLANDKPLSNSFERISTNILSKKCEVVFKTVVLNEEESPLPSFGSSVYFNFEKAISLNESFLIYRSFVRLVQFLGYRRNVYFECESLERENKSFYPSGTLYLSSITKDNCDYSNSTISFKTIMPIFGELINYAISGDIVPLFIPASRNLTFSDSYILATSWAQMIFKKNYIICNKLIIKNDKVYYLKEEKLFRFPFQKMISLMIKESFSYISDFWDVLIGLLLSKISTDEYVNNTLPLRLKTVRNAIAHGSTNTNDYNYNKIDLKILLCAIYYSILSKYLKLDDSRLRLALSELFFDSTQCYKEWSKVYDNK